MAPSEQEKPLAPASATTASPRRSHQVADNEAAAAAVAKPDSRYIRHRKCILCCGCVTSTLVVLAVVVVILSLTVFCVKDPTLTINDVTIKGLELSSPGQLRTDVNITLGARVSVKNPNAAAFRFSNFTMSVYYGGGEVGEARVPAGNARARRTMATNVTVVVLEDKLAEAPGLMGDLRAGELEVESYTVMKGRVKVLGAIKKHVVVGLNCTMTIDLQAESVQIQHCSKHVSF